MLAAVSAAVLARSLAVLALATHHVITAGVLAACLAVTATTGHVITAGLAVRAAALARSTAGSAAVGAACGATGLAFRAARSAAVLARATTTYGGSVSVSSGHIGSGVHLYILSFENKTHCA